MSWNYRVVKTRSKVMGRLMTAYSVREVYYDKAGEPYAVTDNPCTMDGGDPEQIMASWYLMLKAFALPILDADTAFKADKYYPKNISDEETTSKLPESLFLELEEERIGAESRYNKDCVGKSPEEVLSQLIQIAKENSPE